MERSRPKIIFVSYRQSDTGLTAHLIAKHLSAAFPYDEVILDRMTLRGGVRWQRELSEALVNCDAVVAVVGSTWAASFAERRQNGLRTDNLLHELDSVRRLEKLTIASLVDAAEVPSHDEMRDLPDAARYVFETQVVKVRSETFEADADALVKAVEKHVDRTPPPPPPPIPFPWITSVLSAGVGALMAVLFWWQNPVEIQAGSACLLDDGERGVTSLSVAIYNRSGDRKNEPHGLGSDYLKVAEY